MKNFKQPLWWVKLTNYEYWPMFVFYFPILPYLIYSFIKARSLTWFSLANPIEEFGSFFGESKVKALEKIQSKYKPTAFNVAIGASCKSVEENLKANQIEYPFIIKPNWGERGVNVAKINNKEELEDYLKKTDRDSIVQEFIHDKVELGVFYHQMPNTKESSISGIVNKRFLSVIGDGKSTIKELMEKSNRARFQIERIKTKFPDLESRILPKGEKLLLEPIGNHNRGTMFLDANDKINAQLVKVFDDVASTMDGFYYGRFDVKVKDWESLYNGELKILEVNGVYSEPAHIYDPYKWSLFAAYGEIIRHFKIMYKISEINKERGLKAISAKYIWALSKKNYFQNKQVV